MKTSWLTLLSAVSECRGCRLAETRTHTVPGEGDPHAALMLIGEGPGEQEDLTGRPFVGAAGQLLDRILAAAGLSREQVYICNVVKCRPPHNRIPEPDECQACMGYLRQQVALVKPKIILLLGATAAKAVLGPEIRITRDRGVWHLSHGVWILATFHPSALLRDSTKKRPVWEDMQAVKEKMHGLGVWPVENTLHSDVPNKVPEGLPDEFL